jgi:hypothetical protein
LDANDWRCPTRDWEKILDEESSAEGATVRSPGREAGVGNSQTVSAEGAAQNRFERFTIQSSDFAEGQ